MEAVKLSVVIITRNEEINLSRCLDSVAGIADEILIVDSFSTDKTGEIAAKYNAKFIRHAFEGHIEQKNYALSQATYDYVLSLDADEALSPQLRENILRVKNNFTADGYRFNRLTNYCGKWIKHSGWYPDRKLRLFDRRKGKWCGTNPHDRFDLEQGTSAGFLKGDLLHYSITSIAQHIETVNKFSTIAAESKFRKGEKAGIFKILIHPMWKFFRNYFFKLGFLDGYYGFVITVISAHATFIRYVKLRQLWYEKWLNEKNDRKGNI